MDDVIKLCRLQDKHEASMHGGMNWRDRTTAKLTTGSSRAVLPASECCIPVARNEIA